MTQTHGGQHYRKKNNHRSNASGGGEKAGHDGTATSVGVKGYELQLSSYLRTEHDRDVVPPVLQNYTDFDDIIRNVEKRQRKYFDNQYCAFTNKAFIRQN